MRVYRIASFSSVGGHSVGGHTFAKGDPTRYMITHISEEVTAAMEENSNSDTTPQWAAVVFHVNASHDAETQLASARLMCNYMNKVAEAQEKARLGAEIGFLN